MYINIFLLFLFFIFFFPLHLWIPGMGWMGTNMAQGINKRTMFEYLPQRHFSNSLIKRMVGCKITLKTYGR